MTPVQANEWMRQNMFPKYVLGDIKLEGEIVRPYNPEDSKVIRELKSVK